MANAEGLARLWETKAFSDAVIVFTDSSHAVQQAARRHMAASVAAITAATSDGQQPAKSKAKTTAKGKKEGAKVKSCEIPAPEWPPGAVWFETHTAQLLAASKVFEKQLMDNTAMGDNQLYVYSSDGSMKRRLVLMGGIGKDKLDVTEPFMRLVYSQDLPADIKAQPEKLLQVSCFRVSTHECTQSI
jgi:hypothetical protein